MTLCETVCGVRFIIHFQNHTMSLQVIVGSTQYNLAVWQEHLRKPADEYNKSSTPHDFVKDIFLKAEWFLVFDLIEFCLQELKLLRDSLSAVATDRRTLPAPPLFEYRCNQVLEKENSAYRIIEGLVTPITSKQEIGAIGTALRVPYGAAKEHIEKALALGSDRENPDYENSIKESISAVESIAKEVTGESKATLGKLTEMLNLHPAFQDGLNKLYGFTSDVGGIRHGGYPNEDPPLDQATARFMLVLCSAFVNYIIARNPKQQKR
ncbi:MAG: hypothetical protein OXR07_01540 [Nitrospira sp.]|nr:hypothetical protein [Nitrospira sp.]